MAKTIIEVQNLKKYFRNRGTVVKAVDDINFSVNEGEIVGLIGESGSGKTTVGRSLIRLYDDYSGNVKVLGQTVSGKKISKEKRRFLRRNVQMIFQDPHSSLNGQKNVFSIIQEPLKVNGIIREETNKLFKNWKDVTYYFKYTLRYEYLQGAIKIYKQTNDNLNEAFEKAANYLEKLNFEDLNVEHDGNINDIFNALIRPLNAIQSAKSASIVNLYSIQEKLFDVYSSLEKRYLNNDLDLDEKNLVKARNQMEVAKRRLKESDQSVAFKNERQKIIQEKQIHQKSLKDKLDNRTNLLASWVSDLISELLLERTGAMKSNAKEIYAFHLKRSFTYEWSANLISPRSTWVPPLNWTTKVNPEIKHLEIESIQKLFADMQAYNDKFVAQNWHLNLDEKIFPQIKKYVRENYRFNLDAYLLEAQEMKTAITSVLTQFDTTKKELDEKIKQCAKSTNLAAAQKTYEDAKVVFEKVNAEHMQKVDEFVSQQKDQNLKSLEILKSEKMHFKSLRADEKAIIITFKTRLKEFFAFAKVLLEKELGNLNDQRAKNKNIKATLKDYANKASEKLKTLKNFNSEFVFLTRAVKNLKFLYGNYKNVVSEFLHFPIEHLAIERLLTKKTIYAILEDVGLLRQFAYRYPHEFSGGQRQRIVIARALVTKPKLLIADEPIASLDISIQAQIVNLLKALGREKKIGIIFIAHDLSMVEYIANRTIIMHLGKVVEEGQTATIYRQPLHPYTINLFKSIPKISNANVKFAATSFELNYLKGQQFPKVIVKKAIEENHYLFGTEEQIKEWAK